MTDLQKELVYELKEYVRTYVDIAANLNYCIDNLEKLFDGETNEDSNEYYLLLLAIRHYFWQRKRYLHINDTLRIIEDEKKTWEALSATVETKTKEES